MALVKFYRGAYEKYVQDTMSDGIYFAQDEQLIIMNGVKYGGVNMSQFKGFIKDVDVEGQTLSFKKDVDGKWEDISIKLIQAADSSIELGTITTGGVNDGSTIKVKTKALGANEDGLKLDETNGLYVDFTQHTQKDTDLQDAINLLNDADTKEGSVKKTVKDAIEALDVDDALAAGSFVTKVTETDGKIAVSRAAITSSDKTITVTASSTDGALDLKANIDGTTILADKTTGKLSVASEALTQYVGEEAINVSAAVDGEKTISLVINSNDKVLTQDANGLLANLSFSYDEDHRLIKLTGKDNTEIGTVDAKAFIKDGMLAGETVFMAEDTTQSVTIKGQTHEFTGLTKGNHYIAFMFSTSDGETTTYSWDILDATKIIDVYSAGNGLELSDDKHTFSVKKDTVSKDSESFLSISENGVKVSGVQDAIDTAAAASKTEVKANDGDAHIDVTSATAADGHTIYTVASVDTASAKDLTDEIAARKAVDGQNGQTYTANATANYINAATSLNDADIKLDSALKAEADRAAAAEDKIEGSVGLAADGSHVTTSGNYTSKATTVVGEIAELDTQVKTNADAIKALEDAKVSVVKDAASEKYLEVTANDANTVYTVKVSGINDAITTAINALDVTDTAVNSQYVSQVTETDGKIKVTRTDLTAKVTKFTAITGDNTTVEVNETNVQDAVASLAKNVKTNETALTWIDVE